MMRSAFRFGLAVAISLSAAHAADSEKRFAVHGIGRTTCELLNGFASRGAPELQQFGGWMAGYVSSQNQSSPETYDLALFENADTLFLYVLKFCSDNPSIKFEEAVRRVVEGLRVTRIKEFRGFKQFGNPMAVFLHEETFQQMVSRLVDLKLLPEKGPHADADVAKALSAFQLSKAMKTNGLPDQPTLLELMRKQ
jgi:hypothetical protein